MTDDRAIEPVTLRDCLVSSLAEGAKLHAKTARGELVQSGTVVTGAASAEKDPVYPRADPTWDGLGDAFDSRTYPDKGYRSRTK